MRRAVLTILGTIIGIVLLLSFKSQPDAGARPSAALAAPLPSATGPATPATAKDFTGSSVRTPYGPVEVRITVTTAGKLTTVDPLQVPNDRRRSVEISSYAVPQLVQETISAQGANIDMISGATYTSEAYQRSLQSALDKAGIK